MGGFTGPAVFCPGGKKTEVLWSSFLFKQYTGVFSIPGIRIQWERNSDLPPWHTFGTHDTTQTFGAVMTGAYCNFWFTSPVDITVTWG
jgi:hypothetical protein